jgi:hypothetical protein
MVMVAAASLLLAFTFLGTSAVAQKTSAPSSAVDKNYEQTSGQLEEIAMCHHAIKAAYHDSLWLGDNPYFRYVLNSPQQGSRSNIYPIPERCKNIAMSWILSYTKMNEKDKGLLDRSIASEIGMTVPDMAIDVQFSLKAIKRHSMKTKTRTSLQTPDRAQNLAATR